MPYYRADREEMLFLSALLAAGTRQSSSEGLVQGDLEDDPRVGGMAPRPPVAPVRQASQA